MASTKVPKNHSVVVVGGGWAGISTAVELTARGIPVTLIEAARQLGGRARAVRFGDTRVDNGQHIMTGAYRSLAKIMARLEIDLDSVFKRLPLELHMRSLRGSDFSLHAPNVPAPLHLFFGLLMANGLTLKDRIRALQFGRRLVGKTALLQQDISVHALLMSERQSNRIIRALWEPLCLAALNTPIDIASALHFIEVLRRTFGALRSDSDLLLPKTDLGNLLPTPSLDYIESNGGQVLLNKRVTTLSVRNGRITGVMIADQPIPAEQVVIATNPTICRRLLSPHRLCHAIVTDLTQMDNEPICTMYLRYPQDTRIDTDFVGILEGTTQWVFDRGLCGQAGIMAVVISGSGTHMALDNNALTRQITSELSTLFPAWPKPLETLLIREKRATFRCEVGINRYRPSNRTPISGCWIAGDFTDTELPATLESAVQSGLACALGVETALNSGR